MKIVDVVAKFIEVPFSEPGLVSITAPNVVHKCWGFTLVKVVTDVGIVGWGGQNTRFGAWGPYWTEHINLIVRPQLVDSVVDPGMVAKWASEMIAAPPSFIAPRPNCVEMALWDVVGKAAGLPVCKLLGAKKTRVKAYASSFPQAPRWGPKEWVRYAELCRECGFRAVKVKQNHVDYREDIKNVKAIRDALGDEMEVMVDTWQAWVRDPYDLQKAIKLARGYEELGVVWIEEPVPHLLNPNVSRQLAAAVDIPVAGGGQILGLHNFQYLVETDVLDVVQPDVEHAGGILETRNIALMAESHGKWCAPHTFGPGILLAANLQVIGACDAPYAEVPFFPPVITPEVRDSILTEVIQVDSDGYVNIPNAPGLGVEIDEEKANRFATGFQTSGKVMVLGGAPADKSAAATKK